MEPLTWVALAALIVKLVGFIKAITSAAWRDARTQGVVWAASVVVIFLVAGADIANGLAIGEVPLADHDWQSLVVIGLAVGSSGSFGYDVKKAVDNTDTAHEPGLLSGH